MNGVTSATTNQESVYGSSVKYSDVRFNSVVANLREANNASHKSNHSSENHRIILIGDSNIRGYASALEPLLNSNYKVFSVVKPGAGTNELERSANESIRQLTLDDMIIFCYGTNDLDLKKKFSCTFQNIKKLMKNNRTNILLMNIPHQYDRHNSQHVNKIITVLNNKLQKSVKVNPHISFLETFNDSNLYTNHSPHHNKLGKTLVKLQLP